MTSCREMIRKERMAVTCQADKTMFHLRVENPAGIGHGVQ